MAESMEKFVELPYLVCLNKTQLQKKTGRECCYQAKNKNDNSKIHHLKGYTDIIECRRQLFHKLIKGRVLRQLPITEIQGNVVG